jgi:hypothetical protein
VGASVDVDVVVGASVDVDVVVGASAVVVVDVVDVLVVVVVVVVVVVGATVVDVLVVEVLVVVDVVPHISVLLFNMAKYSRKGVLKPGFFASLFRRALSAFVATMTPFLLGSRCGRGRCRRS